MILIIDISFEPTTSLFEIEVIVTVGAAVIVGGVTVLLVLELSSPALVAVTVKAGKLLPALTNAAPVMVKVTAPVLGSMA